MDDLRRDDVTPYPKSIQTTPRQKKYRRKVASTKTWAGIAAERQGPCVLCGAPPPNDLHHVVPRDRGGDDVAENLLALCRDHHQRIEAREQETCRAFVELLWADGHEPGPRGGVRDSYSYAVEKAGETFAESIYGIRFENAAAVSPSLHTHAGAGERPSGAPDGKAGA